MPANDHPGAIARPGGGSSSRLQDLASSHREEGTGPPLEADDIQRQSM